MTASKARSEKPVEHTIVVQANQPWQDSGLFAWSGQILHCRADGQWSDAFGTYGPEGNSEVIKTHLNVIAPANALIMRITGETNMAYYVGKSTNRVVVRSGYVQFRNNVSLVDGSSGSVTVHVMIAPDTDQDMLSDYEEVHYWHTDPLDRDSDGDGFSDYEEIMEKIPHMKHPPVIGAPPESGKLGER